MDDQRQSGLARRRDMRAEALLLRLARAVVVVIVEPGFADRDDLGMLRAGRSGPRGDVLLLCALCGWVPTEQIDIGEALGDRQSTGEPPHPRRDRHHAADAGRARTPDDAVEVVGEIGKIEVAVAVDEHPAYLRSADLGFDIAREHRHGRRQRPFRG